MSDKKLLEEGAIRRFQTLANIKPIGGEVLEEKKAAKKPAEKEEKKEEMKKVEEGNIESGDPTLAGQSVAPHESMEEAGGGMYGQEEMKHEESIYEAEGEGGDDEAVRAALEEIKSGVDKLLSMIGAGVELEVEKEEGEEEAGGMEGGEMEAGEAGEKGEEEEEVSSETLEEKKMKMGHKKAGHKKEEMKDKMEEAKKAHEEEEEEEEKEESLEEALAEELTRRVAARLMREAKKGAAAWGKGTFKSAAVPKKGKGSATKSNWGTKKGTKGHA